MAELQVLKFYCISATKHISDHIRMMKHQVLKNFATRWIMDIQDWCFSTCKIRAALQSLSIVVCQQLFAKAEGVAEVFCRSLMSLV